MYPGGPAVTAAADGKDLPAVWNVDNGLLRKTVGSWRLFNSMEPTGVEYVASSNREMRTSV